MKLSEFDLEQAIWDDYIETGGVNLRKNGLPVCTVMKRQLLLGDYGRADLVGFELIDIKDKAFEITIYELKKDEISYNTLRQAVAYSMGVDQFLPFKVVRTNIILIGSEIESSSMCGAPDVIENLDVFMVKISVAGLLFKKITGLRLSSPMVDPGLLDYTDYKKLLTHG